MKFPKEELDMVKWMLFKHIYSKADREELKEIYEKLQLWSLEPHTCKEWNDVQLAVKIISYILSVY